MSIVKMERLLYLIGLPNYFRALVSPRSRKRKINKKMKDCKLNHIFEYYLFETFKNGRDALLTEKGPVAVVIADAITSLARTGLRRSRNSMGENVDKLLNLGRLTVDHLFQIEDGAVGLERQGRAEIFGHGQLASKFAVALRIADVAHSEHLVGIEAVHILNRNECKLRMTIFLISSTLSTHIFLQKYR